jgi:phospholipid/cholesterol/gamma-HCH transport system ATP-binding protein
MNTPQEHEPLVEVRGLHVRFGRHEVLRGIDLVIPRGQTLAIIGESGCGKTVLLKSIIGLVRPTQGTVRFAGFDLRELGERELAQLRVRIGFVFQGAALFDSLTIGQNVAFPLRQHTRQSDRQIQQAVLERLAEVGLPESVLPKRPAELSGGMRKRVGLARALALAPELVLYDEPTTGLDPIMADIINRLIVDCVKRLGATTISITHDMASARKIADEIAMIYKGEIIWQGEAKTIDYSGNEYVDQFIHGRGEGPIKMEVLRA